MKKFRLPLFGKISIFVTLISLTIIILLSYVAINVNQLTLSLTIKNYYISIIDDVSQKIIHQFERIPEELVKFVTIMNNHNIASQEKINLISLEIFHSESIDFTIVYEKDGKMLDIFYPKQIDLPFTISPSLSEAAIETLNKKRFYQGVPLQFGEAGDFYAMIVIPWEKSGKLLGYIGTYYNISNLGNLIKSTSNKRFGREDNIYLFNSLAEPIFSNRSDKISHIFAEENMLSKLFKSSKKPLAITQDYTINSDRMVTSFQIFPDHKIMIGVEQHYDIAYQSFIGLKKVILIIALITLLFTQFITLLFTRVLTTPLEKLSDLIGEITDKKEFGETVEVKGNDEISDLAHSFNHLSKELDDFSHTIKKDAVIKGHLARFLAPQVVSRITENTSDVDLRNEERDIAVIFADLHDFTTLSEYLPAASLIEILNLFFTDCVEIIYQHNGTVDKFIGDCIMALYNAPYDVENPALMAVRSAIEITKLMKDFKSKCSDKIAGLDIGEISVGIGIAYGNAAVGNVGSNNRVDYTAVGDTVNVGSHLQVLASGNNEILIDEATYEQVKDQIDCEYYQNVKLKTKTKKSDVYRVLK